MIGVLRRKGFLIFLAAILAAAVLMWIPMIGRFSLDDPLPVPVDPISLNKDPKPFLGRRVQVEGEVERIYGPRAFAINKEDTSGPLLLIVGRKPWTLLQSNPQVNDLVRNDHVQVMGRVRRFNLREFQDEGGKHASDTLLKAWEGRPVLLAIDMELTPGVPDYFPGGAGRKGMGGRGRAETEEDEAGSPEQATDSADDAAAKDLRGKPGGRKADSGARKGAQGNRKDASEMP